APERVLDLEVGGRKHLGEEVAKEQLSEPAAELRGPQDIVEARDIAPDLVDLGGRGAELAEALLDVGDDTGGVVEALADGPLAALDEREALAQTVVHLAGELRELLADQLALAGQRLRQLAAERVELLLEESQSARVVGRPRAPGDLPRQRAERRRDHRRRHHH